MESNEREKHLAWDFAETWNLDGTEGETELAQMLASYREEVLRDEKQRIEIKKRNAQALRDDPLSE